MNDITILSGAGLSAESGLKTFRDNNGLWENYDVMEVCSVGGFIKDRNKVLDFYDLRRKDIEDKTPNESHFMQAKLKKEYSDRISIITQNVDDLLEKAGCDDVIHLHGKLRELRCEKCGNIFDIGYSSIRDYPNCPHCNSSKLRHNVVMFGEEAPFYRELYYQLSITKLLVVIGTSGNVLPVDSFANSVDFSILNNLERSEMIRERSFTKCFYGNATQYANKIYELVEDYIKYRVI
ncbi:MAG: NAD-dependent deacetylase [Candidatus Delongbacteria bacterium]|nr:NAD-dependent deacetylase [Candidatus Delongbacteria bacterium]MBN2834328.1 NAD-dependent deacetylase [Candidatus Delongbacteria bacterium]